MNFRDWKEKQVTPESILNADFSNALVYDLVREDGGRWVIQYANTADASEQMLVVMVRDAAPVLVTTRCIVSEPMISLDSLLSMEYLTEKGSITVLSLKEEYADTLCLVKDYLDYAETRGGDKFNLDAVQVGNL